MQENAIIDSLSDAREFFEGMDPAFEMLALANLRPSVADTLEVIEPRLPDGCACSFIISACHHLTAGQIPDMQREQLTQLIDKVLLRLHENEIDGPSTLAQLFDYVTGTAELGLFDVAAIPYMERVLTLIENYFHLAGSVTECDRPAEKQLGRRPPDKSLH